MQRGQNVAWKRFGDSRNSCTTIFQAGKYLERVHTGHITTRQTDSTRMTLKWRVGHGKRVFFSGCGWLKAPRQQILRAKGSLVILLRVLGLTTTWVWLFFLGAGFGATCTGKAVWRIFFEVKSYGGFAPEKSREEKILGNFCGIGLGAICKVLHASRIKPYTSKTQFLEQVVPNPTPEKENQSPQGLGVLASHTWTNNHISHLLYSIFDQRELIQFGRLSRGQSHTAKTKKCQYNPHLIGKVLMHFYVRCKKEQLHWWGWVWYLHFQTGSRPQSIRGLNYGPFRQHQNIYGVKRLPVARAILQNQ